MASAVSIAGLAPIPALKRSPATRTKASAAKVPAASRPFTRASSTAARPAKTSHTTSDPIRMAVSSPASGRPCGHEPAAISSACLRRPGLSLAGRQHQDRRGDQDGEEAQEQPAWRDAALHEVVEAPAGQQREAQHHDDRQPQVSSVTIGIREAISGNGGMPRTTASMSASKTATPTRRSVGRRATAAATSTSAQRLDVERADLQSPDAGLGRPAPVVRQQESQEVALGQRDLGEALLDLHVARAQQELDERYEQDGCERRTEQDAAAEGGHRPAQLRERPRRRVTTRKAKKTAVTPSRWGSWTPGVRRRSAPPRRRPARRPAAGGDRDHQVRQQQQPGQHDPDVGQRPVETQTTKYRQKAKTSPARSASAKRIPSRRPSR